MGAGSDSGSDVGSWGLEHLALAADQILDVIEITDLSYRYLYVNRAFCRLFGYSAEEVMGKTPAQVLRGGEHNEAYYQEIQDTLHRTGSWRGVIRGCARDGTRTEVEAAINPVRGRDGQITHYVAVKRDIKRQREAVDARLERAERLASLGTLAAGVGHELNNPLSYAIENLRFVEARLAASADAQTAEALQDVRRGLQRMARIVADVSDLSQPDNDPGGVADVDDAVRRALSMTANQVGHRARIIQRLGAPPVASASPGRLTQVLVNLLVNAAASIDESRSDGTIEVTTTATDTSVVIEVRDNGAGISAEHIDRLFDPFFSTRTGQGGTGLGLAIAHRIVTSCEGTIEVDSQVRRGTTFRVVLPRRAQPSRAPTPDSAPKQFEGRRLLIIDDDALVIRALQRAMAGAEVVALSSAEAALASIGEQPPFDCILCDLMMPGMSGVDFYERLEEADASLASRVLFMTGGAFTARTRGFADQMGDRVLKKPFTLAQVRNAIADLAT